ncbi:hypothetical protein EX30DRAFT_370731 [Ascodesmis nigricans]|uniref:Mitochondrial intermembrane space import and assembly protein 40 n=1 Tax=Ascodesmis nigricans TaxID=341454 RepID=A0A4S2MZN6_9PEZI|nr:hypothetical protein EX30DRAFT_370731 [Ascodesmis nigricans]
MFRSIPRATIRSSRIVVARTAPRRTLFTTPAQKKPSFKSKLARWGAAGGIVWYFSSSNILADDSRFASERPPVNMSETDPRPPSQLDDYIKKAPPSSNAPAPATAPTPTPAKDSPVDKVPAADAEAGAAPEGSIQQLEEEAGQQGAFNEETGEINWDCPCLGGMAHGPCGEEFKAAFSCFIFSKEEPKGSDCIEHFKIMQKCFMEVSVYAKNPELKLTRPRQHPEIYGDEFGGDEEEENQIEGAQGEYAEGRDLPPPVVEVQEAENDDPEKIATKVALKEQQSEQKKETLAPLDLDNLEATRTPATSAVNAETSVVEPKDAKPDTEPLGEKSQEDKVQGAAKGVEEEQTKRS